VSVDLFRDRDTFQGNPSPSFPFLSLFLPYISFGNVQPTFQRFQPFFVGVPTALGQFAVKTQRTVEITPRDHLAHLTQQLAHVAVRLAFRQHLRQRMNYFLKIHQFTCLWKKKKRKVMSVFFSPNNHPTTTPTTTTTTTHVSPNLLANH
jgi:hypothetical protein